MITSPNHTGPADRGPVASTFGESTRLIEENQRLTAQVDDLTRQLGELDALRTQLQERDRQLADVTAERDALFGGLRTELKGWPEDSRA